MKNSTLYIIGGVLVLVVLVGGYLGRHQLKSMLGMNPTQPTATETVTQAPATTPVTAPASPAAAPSDNIYMTKTDASKGDYLVDFKGMTLYTFDKDTAGMASTCNGACATAWPAYTSGATAESNLPANITVIARSDGSKQFAWKGWPLYYFAKDQKAGDLMGDGVGGIWHIVKP